MYIHVCKHDMYAYTLILCFTFLLARSKSEISADFKCCIGNSNKSTIHDQSLLLIDDVVSSYGLLHSNVWL